MLFLQFARRLLVFVKALLFLTPDHNGSLSAIMCDLKILFSGRMISESEELTVKPFFRPMFMNEVSSAHQGCICLVKNIVKTEIL